MWAPAKGGEAATVPCRGQPGHAMVLRQECHEHSNGAVITEDNWTPVVKPGKFISLSMILQKSSAGEDACPRRDIG